MIVITTKKVLTLPKLPLLILIMILINWLLGSEGRFRAIATRYGLSIHKPINSSYPPIDLDIGGVQLVV